MQTRWPGANLLEQPILRPGSWIGGDRDGNPNVDAGVVRQATGRAANVAFAHYFTEMTALEEELSMSARLVRVKRRAHLRWPVHRNEPARADEPYRRALRVIHARLTATGHEILDEQPEHELDLGLEPLSRREFLADPDTVDASLTCQRRRGAGRRSAGSTTRSVPGPRFPSVWPGHEGRTPEVHEQVVAELLARAGVHPDYASPPEPQRVEPALPARPRPVVR